MNVARPGGKRFDRTSVQPHVYLAVDDFDVEANGAAECPCDAHRRHDQRRYMPESIEIGRTRNPLPKSVERRWSACPVNAVRHDFEIGRHRVGQCRAACRMARRSACQRHDCPFVNGCRAECRWSARRRWYFTAGFSTMPCASWSTMPRWISCHGVWCFGIVVAAIVLQLGAAARRSRRRRSGCRPCPCADRCGRGRRS